MKTPLKIFQIALILCPFLLWAVSVFAQRSPVMPADLNDQHPDLDQSDAGGEYISIIGVRPLNDVVNELQPQFNLTADEALQKAVPDTLNSSESSSSSSRFSLQVGLMTALLNSVNGSNANASSRSAVLNILTNFPFSPGMDPALQYKAAASLYEQVVLLNRSLRDIPQFRDYFPYIVTLQISLIPYRHDAPYDTYADVAFFTDSHNAPESPGLCSESIPLVYPMPTADALEMSNDQQSRNQLQELDFTLAAATHDIGVQAGANRETHGNATASGYDLNSLLTLGRLSQNCLEIRIGARNATDAANQFNMVPETHNVTVLVLAHKGANQLQMLSHTAFRNFKNDALLNELSDEKIESQFLTNVLAYWFHELGGRPELALQQELRTNSQVHATYDRFLFDSVMKTVFDSNSSDSSIFTNFQQAFIDFFNQLSVRRVLKNAGVEDDFFWHPFKGFNANELDAIWLDTVRATDLGDQYANDRIQLPASDPELPDTDLTVLRTDDSQSTTLTIGGGQRLESNKVRATLTCSNGSKFRSDLVDITDGGTSLKIHFPLLTALTNSTDPNLNCFNPSNLDLYLEEGDTMIDSNSYRNFANFNLSSPTSWKIVRTYGALTAGVTNNFSVVLANNSEGVQNTNYLDVAGPIVVAVTNGAGWDFRRGADGLYQLYPTNRPVEVTFQLGPLPSGRTVDFNLWNDKNEFVANLNHQVVYPSTSSQTNTPTTTNKTSPKS